MRMNFPHYMQVLGLKKIVEEEQKKTLTFFSTASKGSDPLRFDYQWNESRLTS